MISCAAILRDLQNRKKVVCVCACACVCVRFGKKILVERKTVIEFCKSGGS